MLVQPPQLIISRLKAETAAKKAARIPALWLLQIFLDMRYAGKTMSELKKAAANSCAKIKGIPVKRSTIDTKKWNPGGVASCSPPMWYGFQVGSFPSSRIRFRMLLCSPMSELGGYSLQKIIATLKRNAMLNIVKSSRVVLCLVLNHRRNEYDYISVGRDLLLSQKD